MRGESETRDDGGGRYARQLALPEVGAEGQARLRRGRVLVVGVGGLGAPAALYLAAAGVGTIGLVDPDAVDVSNLQRQIIHRTARIGDAKVESAAAEIRSLNPDVDVRTYAEALGADGLREMFSDFDFVIEGTDRVETKFLVNDGALSTGTPYSHAGAVGWVGQTMTVIPRRSACLRCLFPVPPDDSDLPTCQVSGVFGAVAGAIGIVQASEALKYLVGIDGLLTDRLLTYDASSLRWRSVAVPRSADCPACAAASSVAAPPARTLASESGSPRGAST